MLPLSLSALGFQGGLEIVGTLSSPLCLSEAAGRRADLREILQRCFELKLREAFQVCLTVNSPSDDGAGFEGPEP